MTNSVNAPKPEFDGETSLMLSNERMHEIAYLIIKSEVRRRGVRYSEVIRSSGQVAKETGVPKAEIIEFSRILNLELHQETFGK
jgi:hypothetical protein